MERRGEVTRFAWTHPRASPAARDGACGHFPATRPPWNRTSAPCGVLDLPRVSRYHQCLVYCAHRSDPVFLPQGWSLEPRQRGLDRPRRK